MSESALFLGVDCSTTACKAIAWDCKGRAVAEGRAPISLENPLPDAWEQDSASWVVATKRAIAEVVQKLGNKAVERVLALSITHQRETFVLTDASSMPLAPALVWMDARCRSSVDAIASKIGAARMHAISGKYPCTTPSLYKLAHLLEENPSLAQKNVRLLDVGAFVAQALTGELVSSVASADPTGLVDMAARDWSDELLGLVGLSRHCVPRLFEPGTRMASLSKESASELGLPAGLPLIAGAGDGQSAALGAGILGPGKAYLNLGTAIVSGVITPDYRVDKAFRTMMAACPGAFLLETDLKGGTFMLTWLVEKLLGRPRETTSEILAMLEKEARTIPRGSDGLLLLPYFHAVMNPYWDDNATGLLLGLHGGQGAAHIYRAILEGIALEQRLHTEGVERASGPIEEMIVMGGGSRSDLWCQMLASVLDKPIVRTGSSEATALGAGILAAYGVGFFSTIQEAVAQMTSRLDALMPDSNRDFYKRLYEEVYVELYPALRGAMSKLASLRQASVSA